MIELDLPVQEKEHMPIVVDAGKLVQPLYPRQKIAITNQSIAVSDADVKAVIPALQLQVTYDFKPYWNADCELVFLPKASSLPSGWWQIVLTDTVDAANALGYHELNSNGLPLAKVFVKLAEDNGQNWTVVLSHELVEMLGDPWVNTIVQGSDGQLYSLEVADPVEADSDGFTIYGVHVSDFITPSWYFPTGIIRTDFMQRTTKQFQLQPGGYISILDPVKGWTQINAAHATPDNPGTIKAGLASGFIPKGGRRELRTIPMAERRWSTR